MAKCKALMGSAMEGLTTFEGSLSALDEVEDGWTQRKLQHSRDEMEFCDRFCARKIS